jgi:hypothetical protein
MVGYQLLDFVGTMMTHPTGSRAGFRSLSLIGANKNTIVWQFLQHYQTGKTMTNLQNQN